MSAVRHKATTFEEWMQCPVYKAHCRACKAVWAAVNDSQYNWQVANRMHMLKVPKVAPQLPEWPAELIAQHVKEVREARQIAANIVRAARMMGGAR